MFIFFFFLFTSHFHFSFLAHLKKGGLLSFFFSFHFYNGLQQPVMSKYRNFVFSQTCDQDHFDQPLLGTIQCKYIVYTKTSDCVGTCDVRGVVVFASRRTISGVMKLMPGYVIRTVIDVENTVAECKQANNFTERGIAPLSNKQKSVKRAELWNLRSISERASSLYIKPPIRMMDVESMIISEQSCVLMPVNSSVVPPLQVPEIEVPSIVSKNWVCYARWVLSVLNAPSFNVTKYTSKKVTLTVTSRNNQEFDFFFASTWLTSNCGRIFFNYKLSKSAVEGSGLCRIQPNEFIDDARISTFDLDCDISCIVFQADCGMGKTQYGMRSLIEKHKAIGHSILLPTENTSLSLFLKKVFPEFSHYEIDKAAGAYDSCYLICQFESIHNLKKMYDVVIIDECTSFFMHASSKTMEQRLDPCLAVIGNHLKNSAYVYAVDADVSPRIVNLLMQWRKHDPPYLVQYTHKPLSNKCLYLSQTKKDLLSSLTMSLRNGDNCVLVLQTIKESEKLLQYFYDKASSILLLNKKGATSITNGTLQFQNSAEQKKSFLTNPDVYFPFCQLFIYTPCIKTGVSFEKPHFQKLYAIASKKSSPVREFQQGLLRVRDISSNKYILHLGDTFIGGMKTQDSNLEKIKRKNAANYFLATCSYNPYGLHSLNLTDILKQSGFDNFTSEFIALGQSEMLESEKHFGVSLISYLCIERGFSFSYLHQLETTTTIDLKKYDKDHEEDLFLLSVQNRSQTSSVGFDEVHKAKNISADMRYELLRKQRFGTITEEEKAQLVRYQFKKDVNITNDEDTVLTSQFLKMYLNHGAYIKRLQHLMPCKYSNEGQTQKLIAIHAFYQCLLEKKLRNLNENAPNSLTFGIESTALKTKVEAVHVRMNAAHTLLVSMGFQWFGDQKHIDSIMLDMQWRQKGFKWYIKNINTARNIFDLKTVQGGIEEESTRKQFLGFVNTVLSQGLGLKIKNLGKGTVQRNYFSLCFEVPFIIPRIGRIRAHTYEHVQDEHLLVLKQLQLYSPL